MERKGREGILDARVRVVQGALGLPFAMASIAVAVVVLVVARLGGLVHGGLLEGEEVRDIFVSKEREEEREGIHPLSFTTGQSLILHLN